LLLASVGFMLVVQSPAMRSRSRNHRPNVSDINLFATQELMRCPKGSPVLKTQSMSRSDYDAAYNSVSRLYGMLPTECTATFCPQADWTGCVLRVAGHDFMDFASGTGGSDGCLDMNDPDNKGLAECLYKGEFGLSVQQAYADHCTKISLADFLIIAAETVMSLTATSSIDFKSNFRYGRTTALSCSWARGRLPDAEDSCDAVERTFVDRMRLSWEESAALMGVHTLGRSEIHNSGYNGFWSDAKNNRRFNNNYFISLLNKGWRPERVNGNKNKNQWFRSDIGADEASLGKEMMLNTDLCLAFVGPRGSGQLNAGYEIDTGSNCCAWRMASNGQPIFNPGNNYYEYGKPHCGNDDPFTDINFGFGEQRFDCGCTTPFSVSDCGDPFDLWGPAFEAVKEFSMNEKQWLKVFLVAWRKSTGNGHSNLKPLSRR